MCTRKLQTHAIPMPYTNTYIHAYIHMHIPAYIHKDTAQRLFAGIKRNIYVYTYSYMYIYAVLQITIKDCVNVWCLFHQTFAFGTQRMYGVFWRNGVALSRHTYTYTYTYIYIYIHICMQDSCMEMELHFQAIHMHIHIHIHMHTYIHRYIHNSCVYTDMYWHIYIHD
jgi:hypothetical protein